MDDKKHIYKDIRKNSSITTLPLLIYLVMYVVSMRFLPRLITDVLESAGFVVSNNFGTFIEYILIYLLCIPVSVIAAKLMSEKHGLKIRNWYKKPEKSPCWIAKWIIIAISITLVANLISTRLFSVIEMIFGITLQEGNLTANHLAIATVPNWVLSIFPALIFAPIFEELLFRGIIFSSSEKFGQLFAIVISGLCFGFWHQNFSQVIYASVMGAFACFLFMKTKSLYPSMILHFLLNGTSVLRNLLANHIDLSDLRISLISASPEKLLPAFLTLLYGLWLSGVVIAGIVILTAEIKTRKGSFSFSKGEFDISKGEMIFAFFTSPVTLIVTMYLVVITVLNAINGYYWFLK